MLCGSTAWADDDEVVGPLGDSISAAPVIVEGEAERSYTSWDGADAATIRTYTPFNVTKVLRGAAPAGRILLRQSGGDTGAASAAMRGAEFSEGEVAIVFLGTLDASDASYDVSGGSRGKFTVLRDEAGRPVLTVRLGADASSYGRAEKAPGTGLARVPVDLFEQLAAGAHFDSVADFEHAHARASTPGLSREPEQPQRPAEHFKPPAGHAHLRLLSGFAVLLILAALGWSVHHRLR